jgi:hypothetical protein
MPAAGDQRAGANASIWPRLLSPSSSNSCSSGCAGSVDHVVPLGIVRLETQRDRVHAVALSGRMGTVVEQMAKVTAAPGARDLDSAHAEAHVLVKLDGSARALAESADRRRGKRARPHCTSCVRSTAWVEPERCIASQRRTKGRTADEESHPVGRTLDRDRNGGLNATVRSLPFDSPPSHQLASPTDPPVTVTPWFRAPRSRSRDRIRQ